MTTPEYLAGPYRSYEERAARYRLAAEWMHLHGLTDEHRVVDLGAGRLELERCLRNEWGWNGRYVPIDMAIDGADLATCPIPDADFYVALEVLEHLRPSTLERVICAVEGAARGVVITVPNPGVQDIRAMDDTHITEVSRRWLNQLGYEVAAVTLYDGFYSGGQPDGLLATKRTDTP